MINPNHFKHYGRSEFVAKNNTTFNEVTMKQDGWNVVEFPDGQRVEYILPIIKLKAIIVNY